MSSVGEEAFSVLVRGPWPRARVSVSAAPAFEIAAAHEPIVERAWRSALEETAKAGQRLFPGPVLGLASFSVEESSVEESSVGESGLALALHRTDYRAFVGTNLTAEYRATGAPCADALGVSIVIEMPGTGVLLHRRGAGCFEWPLAIDTPGGHVEPAAASPFAAALDELESELGLLPADVIGLELLGLARIAETRKPQAVMRARVRVSFEEIASRLEQAKERFETSELLPVARSSLAAIAASSERITPAGRAALRLASEL